MQFKTFSFLLLLLTLSATLSMTAQDNEPVSDTKVVVGGVEFIKHKVLKGEGLYRLSKNYNVTQDEILKANPGMSQALVEGQVVFIPVANTSTVKTVDNDQYILHTVQAKETVYGISSKYGITAQELLQMNPGVAEQGLQMGAVLRIPRNRIAASTQPKVNQVDVKSSNLKPVSFYPVDNGQTLFSISRRYSLEMSELVSLNEGINTENVPTGYILMLPLSVEHQWRAEQFKQHTVGKKETLFAISKLYDVEADVIKLVNPGVSFSNLSKGVVLDIPTSKWFEYQSIAAGQSQQQKSEKEFVIAANNCNDYVFHPSTDVIKIAVLLPFNAASGYNAIQQSDSTDVYGSENVERTGETDFKTVSGKAKLMLEFYEGFLMALEPYKKRGINIQITTYDTGTESTDISGILRKPGISDANFIVGPSFPAQFKAVSEFSIKNKIKLINPFSAGIEEIHNNPYLFQATAIDSMLIDKICNKVIESAKDGQLVLVRNAAGNNDYEKRVIEVLHHKLGVQTAGSSLVEIAFSKGNVYAISDRLVKDKVNYVFVPNDNEVFVNHVTTSLNAIVERGTHQLQVFGIPQWLRFQSIDPEAFHKLNGRIFSYYGIDYQSDVTKQFIASYRVLFQTEPYAFSPYFQKPVSNAGYSRYGIWGYDIATFFVGALVQYGPSFETCIGKMSSRDLIQSNFQYKRISNWGGFYNGGLLLLKFNRDFTVQREVVDGE